MPLAGRLSQFVKQWKKITSGQEILLIVKGYQIISRNLPVQEKPPSTLKISDQQSLFVDQEISESCWRRDLFRKQKQLRRSFRVTFFLWKGRMGEPSDYNSEKNSTHSSLTSTLKWKVCIV